ncbi:MAG: type II secretion system major pseudopilin GspG [Planctomycetaceae bacterium]|jgi:general secretion pathway protein G
MHSHYIKQTRLRSSNTARNGFTLMEVLLVLGILGIIMAMVVPRILGRQKGAYEDVARASLSGLADALKLYALDHAGDFPTSAQGLQVLMRRPSGKDPAWKGPYLEKEPLDPWGTAIAYRFPGTRNPDSFDVSSAGPDRIHGNQDDIGNWQK